MAQRSGPLPAEDKAARQLRVHAADGDGVCRHCLRKYGATRVWPCGYAVHAQRVIEGKS